MPQQIRRRQAPATQVRRGPRTSATCPLCQESVSTTNSAQLMRWMGAHVLERHPDEFRELSGAGSQLTSLLILRMYDTDPPLDQIPGVEELSQAVYEYALGENYPLDIDPEPNAGDTGDDDSDILDAHFVDEGDEESDNGAQGDQEDQLAGLDRQGRPLPEAEVVGSTESERPVAPAIPPGKPPTRPKKTRKKETPPPEEGDKKPKTTPST